MPKSIRIFLAIITALVILACLFGIAFSFTLGMDGIGLAIACILLAAGFGIFLYNDFRYFFGSK